MNLYSRIEEVLPKLNGWCPLDKALALASMVVALKPMQVVEIGVWTGSSLIPMALSLKENGYGFILGIDPYQSQASAEGQIKPEDRKFWSQHAPHEASMNGMLKWVEELDLKKVVRIVRKRSDEVVPPDKIDLLHIDGNHGIQVLRDVSRYCPSVRMGGLVVMDDLDWTGGAVQKASDVMLTTGFIKLYPLGTGAVYQKVK